MIGRSACTGLAVAALGTSLALACAVDDRTLVSGGAGSLASAGAAGTRALIPASDAGDGGVEAGLPPLPICDYGAAVEAGCESLVSNPGFAKDSSGWSPEPGSVSMSWTPSDAADNKRSGSLSVVNSLSGAADGTAARGAAQCLPTVPGQPYGLAADLFIPEGQGAGLDGGTYSATAGLSVIFYNAAACGGYTLGNGTSTVLDEAGRWEHREGHAVAPAGAVSMAVRLVTFKNFRELTFEARFDNVLVKAE